MKKYGRTTIYANYTEQEILNASEDKQKEIILDIMKSAIHIHNNNKLKTRYLRDFYEGNQDIYSKVKITRPEINNKTVENWAYALTDFKKCWLLGKPIQYVQIDDKGEKEVSKLNEFCRFENKSAKDLLLYENILVAGRAYRYVAPDAKYNEDEAPFEIINVDNDLCEVVYSSQLGHEQLLSFIETSMMYIDTDNQSKKKYYKEYTIYLRNKKFVLSGRNGLSFVGEVTPLVINEHYITEYYLNSGRISLIELGKDLFNDINYLESLDKDDMEQFVNAIMVFQNAEVSQKEIEEIRELGAVQISSTDGREAKVYLLEQRLNANTTQTYYSRLLNALHQILGIPKASDTGEVSYGDTGQARLTGQGYTSAGIRADGDEIMFDMCDKNSLKTILKICREKTKDIKDLKTSQVEAKFQRNMSDNLLVKTQALMNLYSAKIPRKFANAIVGLFNDPNAITVDQEKIFGPEQDNTNNKDSDTSKDIEQKNNNKVAEQNNVMQNINNKAIQNQ